ncbi:hypothetical protein CVT24_009863 [Panaeolus cyanescens]|uniref:C3H1-type domain-containing protein n=1 Tax=Panaeolus cyanescens TaxID=181874 RepID=A0A409VXZ9_9AGAR|nr:hypothetical protein CVT24_009863 [Panaeolus cyanescens]
MVSPLWKACSEGQLDIVVQLLADATNVDIELKDHTGATPLIEAVKNGHVEIVKLLLDNGADATNASSQGRPDQYTSDSVILELLRNAQNKSAPNGVSSNQSGFNPDGTQDSEKQFYGPDGFSYYPNINPSIPPVNENVTYYPPAHLQHPVEGLPANGIGNLPPPEIARMIPCRYFPACRYGAQCMFAHPQTPYFQGPMPPVQYPPFDPTPFGPQYYPSPPFQQPPNVHPMSPMSPPPGPPIMHARTPSEVVSPPPFSPNGAPHPPPPVPYNGPVYPHPGQMPIHMGMPPIPAVHHSPTLHTHPGPQSAPNYPTSPVPPFPMSQDGAVPYPPVQPAPINYSEPNGASKPELPHGEHFSSHPNHREGGHIRRHTPRRSSMSGRKPPCLFFPAGRCKNGDDCRFPHVLNDNMGTPHPPSFPVVRGPPRSRGPINGHASSLEVKMNNLNIRDEQPRQKNGDTSSRSHSSDGGHRKFPHPGKHHSNVNGHNQQHNKKGPHSKPTQRVPNADDFPVLAGTTTPPKILNGVSNGLTAAQVLQAPAPVRKESKEPSTRGASPDPARSTSSKDAKAEMNGVNGANAVSTEAHVNGVEHVAPAVPTPVAATPAKPPVMSFAAAAAANSTNNGNHASSAANADVSKEVSVSA